MSDTPQQQSPPVRRRGRRRLRLAGLIAAALVAVMSFAYLAVTAQPISLPGWVTDQAQRRVNAALDGPRVTLGGVQVTVARSGLPQVRLRNVGIFDVNGFEVARLNEVGARIDARALLRGELRPRLLRLSGAQINLRRSADGQFNLSFGQRAGASGTLAGVLNSIDAAFASGALSGVARIDADQLDIVLEDARSGRVWHVTGGRLTLDHNAEALDLSVAAEVFNGTEDLASMVIGFRTTKGVPDATLTASFQNAAAADIAVQSPVLSFLKVLNAPISGALRTSINRDGELDQLAGTLEIGIGALQPTEGAPPIPFDAARAYFEFDPKTQRIDFSQLSVQSDTVRLSAHGHAYLREFQQGWPAAMLAQMAIDTVAVDPEGLFEAPVEFTRGALDVRMRLDPFVLDLGQLILHDDYRKVVTSGRIEAASDGWTVALDAALNEIAPDRLMAFWPLVFAPKTRDWLSNNIRAGLFFDVNAALRAVPGGKPRLSVSYEFRDSTIRFMDSLPQVEAASGYASILNDGYAMMLESGQLSAPQGGTVDVAGTMFRIPDLTAQPSRGLLTLRTDSTIPAVLSVLDLPPFNLMQRASRPIDLAEGRATVTAALGFDLGRFDAEKLDYQATGQLTQVQSDTIVPGRTLAADRLELRASRDGIEISGRGRLGQVEMTANWAQAFGPDAGGRSQVEATVDLSQAFLDEFGISLPKGSVNGTGKAQVTLDLAPDTPPAFRLISDLNRLVLRLDALGWSKAANQTGRLEVTGRLGTRPAIDKISLTAPGLKADGSISLTASGALERARFDRVVAGNWLDAPVTLAGRGAGITPAIEIGGGRLDLRLSGLGDGSGGGGSGGGAPMTVLLDRLQVTEGIALTEFRGSFDTVRGLEGTFSGKVNGGSRITGRLAPQRNGSTVQITGRDAGGAIASSGMLDNARGGQLELVLQPTGNPGVYDGTLNLRDTTIVRAPILTEILAGISVVGLLDQMNSGGIRFDTVEANFRMTRSQVQVSRSSAVGPSLGISLDGVIDFDRGLMDMQGVVSPIYFVNGIGQIFSRRGEGLFGFNFRLRGATADPRVSVNPLSILTPGMFRDIFRRPPPQTSRDRSVGQ